MTGKDGKFGFSEKDRKRFQKKIICRRSQLKGVIGIT